MLTIVVALESLQVGYGYVLTVNGRIAKEEKGRAVSEITLLSRNLLPYLSGNHARNCDCCSPVNSSESIYWQHEYSADTIIQTIANVF